MAQTKVFVIFFTIATFGCLYHCWILTKIYQLYQTVSYLQIRTEKSKAKPNFNICPFNNYKTSIESNDTVDDDFLRDRFFEVLPGRYLGKWLKSHYRCFLFEYNEKSIERLPLEPDGSFQKGFSSRPKFFPNGKFGTRYTPMMRKTPIPYELTQSISTGHEHGKDRASSKCEMEIWSWEEIVQKSMPPPFGSCFPDKGSASKDKCLTRCLLTVKRDKVGCMERCPDDCTSISFVMREVERHEVNEDEIVFVRKSFIRFESVEMKKSTIHSYLAQITGTIGSYVGFSIIGFLAMIFGNGDSDKDDEEKKKEEEEMKKPVNQKIKKIVLRICILLILGGCLFQSYELIDKYFRYDVSASTGLNTHTKYKPTDSAICFPLKKDQFMNRKVGDIFKQLPRINHTLVTREIGKFYFNGMVCQKYQIFPELKRSLYEFYYLNFSGNCHQEKYNGKFFLIRMDSNGAINLDSQKDFYYPKRVDNATSYTLNYNSYHFVNLPPPYTTRCNDYGDKSQMDCFNDCTTNMTSETFTRRIPFRQYTEDTELEVFDAGETGSFTEGLIKRTCLKRCEKQDCEITKFQTSSNWVHYYFLTEHIDHNFVRVIDQEPSDPNYEVINEASLDLFQFLTSIIGTISFWFGVGILEMLLTTEGIVVFVDKTYAQIKEKRMTKKKKNGRK